MWQMLVMLSLMSVYMFAQYNEKLRNSHYYLLAALGFSVISNILWVSLARKLSDQKEIFKYGFYWDTSTYLPIILIPLIFFGMKQSPLAWFGVGLIVIGVILLRVGGQQ